MLNVTRDGIIPDPFTVFVICSFRDYKKFKVEIKPDSHCPFGSTYLVTNPNTNMFDVNEKIKEQEKQIKRLTWLSEHRLKGIKYWMSK